MYINHGYHISSLFKQSETVFIPQTRSSVLRPHFQDPRRNDGGRYDTPPSHQYNIKSRARCTAFQTQIQPRESKGGERQSK